MCFTTYFPYMYFNLRIQVYISVSVLAWPPKMPKPQSVYSHGRFLKWGCKTKGPKDLGIKELDSADDILDLHGSLSLGSRLQAFRARAFRAFPLFFRRAPPGMEAML